MHAFRSVARFAMAASSSVDALVSGKVIPDVLDMFAPSIDMHVYYGNTQVIDGCQLTPSATASPPAVQIAGNIDSGARYTLVMSDPDAPNPSKPVMREWLHWIVIDIPGGTDATGGKQIVPYNGPTPPVGMHRYVFSLFSQTKPMKIGTVPERAKFNTRKFAAEHGLGLPVAATYFYAQK